MKKIKFKCSLRSIAIALIVCFTNVFPADARPVSLEEAMVKAQRFLHQNSEDSIKRISGAVPEFKLAYEAKTTDEKTSCFYVLNNIYSKGYVIASADDRLPEVLGYSDSESFDIEQIPDNMKWWLSEYQRQIENVLSSNGDDVSLATNTHRAEWTEIQPLMTTEWNQVYPYNNLCPTINGKKTFTGCVATAIAQIMKYHQWPIKGRGSNSYENWDGQMLSMDFSEITFDWANMPDEYKPVDININDSNAVSILMYAVGIACDMRYDLTGSGANDYSAAHALLRYFDYDASVLEKNDTDVDWANLIYEELANNRPIYYSGKPNSTAGGHAFVCDGYSHDGLFHINWGWGGSHNGYFLLSNLDPYEGTESEGDGYNNDHIIIYGIHPFDNEKKVIDGVNYAFYKEEGKAAVLPAEEDYTGDLIIPQTVTYDGKTYEITEIKPIWNGCRNLTSLVIYPSITKFDVKSSNYHTYWDRSPELNTVILPNTVHIEGRAFWGCHKLTTLEFGHSLKSIGGSAFWECGSLTELVIPDNVETIGDGAFDGCTSLTTLQLGYNLKSIGNRAFEGCGSLTELVIPDNVETIGGSAFHGCNSLTNLQLGNNLKSIDGTAFEGCGSLTELIIPNNVETIGERAFYDCNSLTNLQLGNNLKSIGNGAFYGCHSLAELVIPDNVETIEVGAFSGCTSLTTLQLGNNLESIEGTVFDECNSLTKLIIPDNVKTIGYGAFHNCTSLTTLQLGNNLESIDALAFYNCNSLTSLQLGDNLKSIDNWAFYGCHSLTSLQLGNNLKSIGNLAFSSCHLLTELVIPDNVETIGELAFQSCSSLKTLQLGSNLKSIGIRAFLHCNELTEIIIPDNVILIGDMAFYCSGSHIKIVIPNSVKTIGEGAFEDDGFRPAIRTIISYIEEPIDLLENSFSETAFARDTLYVPYGTIEKYQAKDIWKNYENIIEMPNTQTVSVGEDGLSTYCSTFGVDFSNATGIAAYKASVDDGVVALTRVNTIAAGEGVLLRSLNGGAVEEELPTATKTTKNANNAFVGVVKATTLDEKNDDFTNFVLSKKDGVVGFFKANKTPIAAGKSYLPVRNYHAETKSLGMMFDDTTGIGVLTNKQTSTDDAIYTLGGVRMMNPTKGIYIKNGKKMVVK